jgi:hypothetical protein
VERGLNNLIGKKIKEDEVVKTNQFKLSQIKQ